MLSGTNILNSETCDDVFSFEFHLGVSDVSRTQMFCWNKGREGILCIKSIMMQTGDMTIQFHIVHNSTIEFVPLQSNPITIIHELWVKWFTKAIMGDISKSQRCHRLQFLETIKCYCAYLTTVKSQLSNKVWRWQCYLYVQHMHNLLHGTLLTSMLLMVSKCWWFYPSTEHAHFISVCMDDGNKPFSGKSTMCKIPL